MRKNILIIKCKNASNSFSNKDFEFLIEFNKRKKSEQNIIKDIKKTMYLEDGYITTTDNFLINNEHYYLSTKNKLKTKEEIKQFLRKKYDVKEEIKEVKDDLEKKYQENKKLKSKKDKKAGKVLWKVYGEEYTLKEKLGGFSENLLKSKNFVDYISGEVIFGYLGSFGGRTFENDKYIEKVFNDYNIYAEGKKIPSLEILSLFTTSTSGRHFGDFLEEENNKKAIKKRIIENILDTTYNYYLNGNIDVDKIKFFPKIKRNLNRNKIKENSKDILDIIQKIKRKDTNNSVENMELIQNTMLKYNITNHIENLGVENIDWELFSKVQLINDQILIKYSKYLDFKYLITNPYFLKKYKNWELNKKFLNKDLIKNFVRYQNSSKEKIFNIQLEDKFDII